MKKLILFLLATSCILVACNNDKNNESASEKKDSMSSDSKSNMPATTDSKAERNRQTALAGVKAVNAHDVNSMVQDAATEGVDYGDGTISPVKSLDSIKAGIKAWLNAFPDVKSDNLEAFSNADGSKVIVVGEWTGTFKNDFMGMKATNKSYKIWDGDLFTFNDDGKMTSHRSIQSGKTIMMQVEAKQGK